MRPIKGHYFIKLTSFAFVLGLTGIVLAGRLKIDSITAFLMIVFLWANFAFFGLFYTFIKKRKGNIFFTGYFLLLALKLVTAIAGAFLFLSPDDRNIKLKALFYLFGYFILSMVDISIKVHDLNKKLDN